MTTYQLISAMLLAAPTKITGGGWASNHFAAIRSEAISASSSICSMAMAIGSILVAFQLIKMYYDMASDEQHGGFGGIRAWDILRPLTMLFVIMSMGTILPWLDAICNGVSSALVANMNGTISADEDKLTNSLENLEDEISKSKEQIARETREDLAEQNGGETSIDLNKKMNDYLESKGIPNTYMTDKGHVRVLEGNEYTDYKDWDSFLMSSQTIQDPESDSGQRVVTRADLLGEDGVKEATDMISLQKAQREKEDETIEIKREGRKLLKFIQKGGNILGNLATWLFNFFFVIIMAFADITLCLLAIFGPLAAALSVLESWRGTFKNWLGSYIEVSMWKPVGCAICWVVVKAKHGIATMGLKSAMYTGMDPATSKATIWATIGVEALILFAGMKALKQVPSITSSILSIGSSSLGSSAGGSGGEAMGAAAGLAAGGAGKIAGGAAGGAGKIAGSTLGGAVQGMSQGVGAGFGARVGFLRGLDKIRK